MLNFVILLSKIDLDKQIDNLSTFYYCCHSNGTIGDPVFNMTTDTRHSELETTTVIDVEANK